MRANEGFLKSDGFDDDGFVRTYKNWNHVYPLLEFSWKFLDKF
jgi:hypothetical protein